jgi:putative intracellular protease/amidase
VLKGRTAAAFRDRYTEAAFAEGGARLASDHVVVDGRLVTGDGPEAASPFAEAILGLLTPPARKGP